MPHENTRFYRRLARWLQAEHGGDEIRAEQSFQRVFRLLAVPAPGRDLVAETMLKLGFEGRSLSTVPGGVFKTAVACALAAAGSAVVIAPSVVAPWLQTLKLSWIVNWWTATIIGASQRLANGLEVWRVLEKIGETLAMTLASPVSVAALSLAIVIIFATFRALTGLVSLERSVGNA